jgi:hypothetical protein
LVESAQAVALFADRSAASPARLLRLADDAGCDCLALRGVVRRTRIVVPTDFRAKHSCCFGCRARFAVLRVDEEVETQQLMKRIVRGWQIES